MAVDPARAWLAHTFEFQMTALAELEAAATAGDELSRCAAWLAVERQSQRVAAAIAALSPSGRLEPYMDIVAAHRALIEALSTRAARQASTFSAEIRDQARHRLGLRIALAGKGGAGKSVISGTLCRIRARRGSRVLAVDLDSMPGLALSLGVPKADRGLPAEAIQGDGGWSTQLAPGLRPLEAVERFAAHGPDGVRYLGIGTVFGADQSELQRSIGPIFQILLNFAPAGWDVIADLEAGPRGPFQGVHMFADLVVLVLGPSGKSELSIRRLRKLISSVPTVVVANRCAEGSNQSSVEPFATIPDDPSAAEADRLGVALMDHDAGAPAVAAISQLADRLEELATAGAARLAGMGSPHARPAPGAPPAPPRRAGADHGSPRSG